MAAKIILFLSDLKEDAAEKEYTCPDGSVVSGTLTNEAPVRYLLRQHPTVRQVICVVTHLARQSAWERFEEIVNNVAPAAVPFPVEFEEQQDFGQTVIPQILTQVHKRDDIFLDLTGGFRNANMHLLLLSRVLSYCGIRTAGAVYSNFRAGRVEDISHLFSEFDLVAGLQELTNLGSVRTLRAYYNAHPPAAPEIDELLSATEALTEAITLCRTKRLGDLMEQFWAALTAVENCGDPLMQQLPNAFRDTVDNKFSTPGLIKWCLRNDMLQQALTIYTERIPAYIFSQGILRMDATVQREFAYPLEDADAVQFMRGFLQLSKKRSPDPAVLFINYVKQYSDDIYSLSHGRSAAHEPPSRIQIGVENLALIAKLAYPDNRYRSDWTVTLPEDKHYLRGLAVRIDGTKPTAQEMIRSVASFDKEHLQILLCLETQQDSQADRIATIEDLAALLPGSGYSMICSVNSLQAICRDYLYVKMLRNLTNHAADELTGSQMILMDYLRRFDYPAPETVTAADLCSLLKKCMDNIQNGRKKEKKK